MNNYCLGPSVSLPNVTLAQLAMQYFTCRIVKRSGWVSFPEKLGEKGVSMVMSHIMKKLESFSYIFVADTMGLATVSLMQLAQKAIALGKMTQNNGHYTVQRHSRSLILVPIKSPYETS